MDFCPTPLFDEFGESSRRPLPTGQVVDMRKGVIPYQNIRRGDHLSRDVGVQVESRDKR